MEPMVEPSTGEIASGYVAEIGNYSWSTQSSGAGAVVTTVGASEPGCN